MRITLRRHKLLFVFCIYFLLVNSNWAQDTINIEIDASANLGSITPLWSDFWEYNMVHGYGDNPALPWVGDHVPFCDDPEFVPAMQQLKPRSIRYSVGAFTNLPNLDFRSTDTSVLKLLPTEFYRGANTMLAADDPDNYYFEYLDQHLEAIEKIGAQSFLCFDYMPFTLSANKNPIYHPLALLIHLLAPFDNQIRTSKPADAAVYARVVRNVLRHTRGMFKGTKDYGVEYVEVWNEPDHQFYGFLPQFWYGSEEELFEMYKAIAWEIDNDAGLKDKVKLGGCSFGVSLWPNPFRAENFMQKISQEDVRLDFFSFHPYDSVNYALDTLKLEWAKDLVDQYAPGAELVNAEWGALDPPDHAWWLDLDYSLLILQDIIRQIEADIKIAHYVTLVDNSIVNPSLPEAGLYTVPGFEPKIPAVIRQQLNQIDSDAVRLAYQGKMALAALQKNESEIIIFIPATKPNLENFIRLKVENLPFNNFDYSISTLSEGGFQSGNWQNVVEQGSESGSSFERSGEYLPDGDSGILFMIQLNASSNSIDEIYDESYLISPNPVKDLIHIESKAQPIEEVEIIDLSGKCLKTFKAKTQKQVDLKITLEQGMYYLRINKARVYSIKVLP